MYEKKLSIIIPTKNRQVYAAKCVKTLLNCLENDFEIVVHDNSDDASLREMLEDVLNNSKVVYAYESSCLSFCDNFERAIELSCGDYMVMIGDDDCVLPQIIELTNTVREKNIEAVVFPTPISYTWPNAVKDDKGTLVIRDKRPYIKTLYTNSAIKEMMDEGNYDYQYYQFPKIYHGIIKREKFDCVKEKTGHYFGGLTPDIYSAISLSFYIEKYLYINYPFTLPGMCAKSGSADSVSGRHTGELKDAPHFRGHHDYKWDDKVPYLYTVDTIWAETAFKAMQENGLFLEMSDKQYFNFIVYIARRSDLFIDRLADSYSSRTGTNIEKVKCKIRRSVRALNMCYFVKKVYSFGCQIIQGRHTYRDVADIEKAVLIARETDRKNHKIMNALYKMDW